MATKKTKKDESVHLRFKADEIAPLDADRKSMPGVPVNRGAYMKHAAVSFPKLRKLEELCRLIARSGEGGRATSAAEFLNEAGL